MKKTTGLCAALLPLLLAATSCRTTATVTSAGGPSISEAQAVPYNGPKARITVSRFTNKTAKGGDIGDGMTEMLSTALFNTNRFIVLERQELGEVMREQDLGASGRIKKGTEAPIGEIEGAELMVVGAITEFEPNASGIGGGVGLGGFPVATGAVGGVKSAHVAIDIRVIDAKTSRIVAAQSVQGRAHDIGGLAGMFIGGAPVPLGIGLGGYSKTPMEKAVRICLQAAVDFIARQTPANYYHY